MSEWFYAQNGQQNGPVSEEQLQALADSGQLQPDDLIWKDGMPNWVPAGHTEGLFVARQAATQCDPPPGAYADQLPPTRGAAYSSPTYADDWDERPRRRPAVQQGSSKGVWFGIIGGILAVGLIAGAIIFIVNNQTSGDSGRKSFTLRTGAQRSFNVPFKKGDVVEINAKAEAGKHIDIMVFDDRGKKVAGSESPTHKCRVVFTPERSETYKLQIINPRIMNRPEFNRTMSGELTWKSHDPKKLAKRDQNKEPEILSKRQWSLNTNEASTHYVRLKRGKSVEVTVRSNGQSDVDLFIFNSSGRRIARDEGLSSHCRLLITPSQTETYKLQVVNRNLIDMPMRNGFNSGTLKWQVLGPGHQFAKGNEEPKKVEPFRPINKDIDNPPPPLLANPVGVQNPPFRIQGVLTKTSPRLPGGKPYRLYTVSLQAGRVYTIEMNGTFDTYLYLKSAAGKTVMLNDDGGPGLNSKMTYRPRITGVYRLYASAFSSRHSGTFTLTVR